MTRKIMVATLKEMWDNRLLILVMVISVVLCSDFQVLYTHIRGIDYNQTYVDIMYVNFFNYLQFIVCACVVNGFYKLGKNNFWDVELSTGISIQRYVNIKFLLYMLLAMLIAVLQSGLTIIRFGRGIQTDINEKFGNHFPTETQWEPFFRTQVLSFFMIVIPIVAVIILVTMLVTVITRSVIPAMIIDAVYVFASLREKAPDEMVNKFLFPGKYIRNYIITVKDDSAWNRGIEYAEKYTLEGSIISLLVMLGVCVCVYILLIVILKKRKFV